MKTTNLLALALAASVAASCGQSPKTGSSSCETAISAPGTSSTITAGSSRLTWIQDIPGPMKHGKETFPDIPDSILSALGCQDGIPSTMSCFLLESEGQKVLFDAGLGGENSLLVSALKEMGTNPEDLKLIYITHLHGDHTGNLVKDGQKVFPNAKIYISRAECEAWRAMDSRNEAQIAMMNLYKDNLVIFEAGDTLPAGVASIPAYGHTAGHTIYQKGNFLIVGDIMHGLSVQINYPEYSAKYDADPQMAAGTRKQVIEYAKANGLTMAGMHFPVNEYKFSAQGDTICSKGAFLVFDAMHDQYSDKKSDK